MAAASRGNNRAARHCFQEKSMTLTVYHWLLIAAFAGVVIWAFGRKRKARFEKDGEIPFESGKDRAP
jgi:cytochrome c oxidase cbb3-type subunit IV